MRDEKKFCIRPFEAFIILSIVIMIFQYNISSFFSGINYYDEIFSLVIFATYIVKNCRRLKNKQLLALGFLIVTIFVGLLGNILYSFQKTPLAIIGDILSVTKVPMVLIGISETLSHNQIKHILSRLRPFFKVYIYISAIVAVYAYATQDINFFEGERYGISAYKFISHNAGVFGYVVMGILAAYTFGRKYPETNAKSDHAFKAICLILILLTTKGPQLIFVALYIFFYLFRLGKLRWYHFLFVSLIAISLMGYQIDHYIKPTEARFALTVGSVKIAKDYFPIGTGFATFGSEMSKAFDYSQVYILYGLNKIRGLNIDYAAYVTDNYWPMLIGQFGFIVASIFFVYYVKLYKQINTCSIRSAEEKQVFLVLFITFMVGSLGSAYLTSVEGVIDFIYIGMFLNRNIKTKDI